MIRYLFFLLLILHSSLSLAAVQLDIAFPKDEIKQGALERAVIKLNEENAQTFPLQKLKGQTFGEVLYLQSLSPLVKKDGAQSYEADATVIFLKVPQSNFVSHKINGTDLEIKWPEVKVSATEPGQGFLFGTFEVPSRARIGLWMLIALGLMVTIFGGARIRRNIKAKKELKARRTKLKDEIISIAEYEDIVSIWQRKSGYLREFPHIEEAFKNFEVVLFKYQFKPRQSEAEKTEVMTAYKEFVANIQGGFDGI